MKLTILGSGTGYPNINRNMSGYLLEIGNKKILFDSGPGTIRQLLKLNINILDIDHLFYTHLHVDHVADLQGLIWCNNYGAKRKKPLNVYGPKGFKKYWKNLLKILKPSSKSYDFSYKINVEEINNKETVKIKTKQKFIKITGSKVKHKGECSAYRIEYNKKSIVYSGDTGYCKNIVDIAKESDILILECSLPKRKAEDHHLTPEQCGMIAKKSSPKKLILTHFYPEVEKVDILKLVTKEYDGVVIKAKDLMGVKV